jgi:hypothetical protein
MPVANPTILENVYTPHLMFILRVEPLHIETPPWDRRGRYMSPAE